MARMLLNFFSMVANFFFLIFAKALGQQRKDGGGCASMRERSERVESPGTHVTE